MRLLGLSLVALTTFAMGSASAENDKQFEVHTDGSTLSGLNCAECGRKAVQALGQDKFLFAEVDAEGNVRGWSEKAAVAVLIWPGQDCVHFMVMAASRDKAEAKRVSSVLCKFLKEDPTDPKAPARLGSADSFPKGKIPVIHSRHEQRAIVPTLQFFEQGASIAFQKQGLRLGHTTQTLVGGQGQGAIAVTFIAPGGNSLSAHFGVHAVSWDQATSSRLTDAVWREVVKVLFE
jgi:hypothetical protein